MKVRCTIKTKSGRDVGKYEIYFGDVTKGEIYEVLSISKNGWYRIIDASEEDYLYPPNMFEIVESEPVPPIEESKIKKNNDIIFNNEKSDPPSMSEEEYFKARDEYIQKVRKESEKNKEKNGYQACKT
jgi:hypothetical protein